MSRLLELAVVVAVVWVAAYYVSQQSASQRPDVVTFLQSEPMQELVTEKIATQVIVERDFGGTILGPDRFLAYGVVEMFVGVDLSEMKVTKVGENYIVDLPTPHIFHTSLDEKTLRVFRNATALQRFNDLDAPKMNSDIRLALLAAGEQFAKDRDMIPSREDVIKQVRKTFDAAGIDDTHILFTAPGS